MCFLCTLKLLSVICPCEIFFLGGEGGCYFSPHHLATRVHWSIFNFSICKRLNTSTLAAKEWLWFNLCRTSKHLERRFGTNWRGKVSPMEYSPVIKSSVAPPTTDSSSAHPTPTQSAEEATDQLHPSPPQGITESMPTTTHPTVEAPVDPAVRFAQCKEEGNSLVKQVDNVLLLLLLFLCQSVFICFLMLQKRSAAFAFVYFCLFVFFHLLLSYAHKPWSPPCGNFCN